MRADSKQLMKPLAHLYVRAPNWVGDLVMATPVLEAALAHPDFGRVTIGLREHLVDVLGDGPCETALHPLARGSGEMQAYRELAPDAVLLLTNSLGAAWRAFRAGVGVRAGAALSGRRPFLTHALVPESCGGRRTPVPTAHLLRDIAGLLDIRPGDLHPRLGVGVSAREGAERALEAGGHPRGADYVLCCPGAAFGAAKLWPPASFAAVLDQLFERHGLRAVVAGAPAEQPLVSAVVSQMRCPGAALASDARGLASLRALVSQASLVLVGDSGPRWYAAAFDVPCVTVMGPNLPELTASSLELCRVVRREDLECAPCLERVCPLGHHRCMVELSTTHVLRAAEELLELSPSGA